MEAYHPCMIRLLRSAYQRLEGKINRRLEQFRELGQRGSEEDLFAELVFCLLTPQSKARACWAAVQRLRRKGLLLRGGAEAIEQELSGVRFHRTKARRIVQAREQFGEGGQVSVRPVIEGMAPPEAREWLVKNVNGLGYKEASHFLRNIGRGEDLAILDRHILKNLWATGAIEEVPKSLSRRRYIEIEDAARKLAEFLEMSLGQLDLLLWARETGEVFK